MFKLQWKIIRQLDEFDPLRERLVEIASLCKDYTILYDPINRTFYSVASGNWFEGVFVQTRDGG